MNWFFSLVKNIFTTKENDDKIKLSSNFMHHEMDRTISSIRNVNEILKNKTRKNFDNVSILR